MKHLRILQDGIEQPVSAGTRSWESAEAKAQEIRDSWDPDKQRIKALLAKKEAEEVRRTTIADAVDRWVATVTKHMEDEHSRGKYVTAGRKIKSWAEYETAPSQKANKKRRLEYLDEITRDNLDQWVVAWGPGADRKEDRFAGSTAGALLEKIKNWLDYCCDLGWIEKNPASRIKPIKRDRIQTLPLLHGRFEAVLDATQRYDASLRPDDRFGQELRAIFLLMRWTGLRLSDAVLTGRSRIIGNRFQLVPHKTRKTKASLIVILPDHVLDALNALPLRADVDPRYFFWSGKGTVKSLTGRWQKKIAPLNGFLELADYQDIPQPLRFHSHQLRDTFAVEALLAKTRIEDVSLMLGHRSVRVTERYYSAWVPARQAQLEQTMIDAVLRQGALVSRSG